MFQGCGFYPDGFFGPYCRNDDAMQVRIVGPNVGIAKGMILKKQGISTIQLPESMRKVEQSHVCNDDRTAGEKCSTVLFITRNT